MIAFWNVCMFSSFKRLLQLCLFVMSLFSVSVFAEQKALTIIPLNNSVYQHISYQEVGKWGLVAATGLIVMDGKDAYLLDTPWSDQDTQALLDWIVAKGYRLKGAVVTHFHKDASGGLGLLNDKKIPTYAFHKTNQLLRDNKSATASNIFSDKRMTLVKDKVELFYPGPGHSSDNIVVWLKPQGILFGGCFVKGLYSKGLGNLEDANVTAWLGSITNTINTFPEVKTVVPGHGKIGDASLLTHTARLIENHLSVQ